VNTQFVAHAIHPIADGRPVHIVAHPLRPGPIPPEKDMRQPFTVLVIFNVASGFARKNPCASIKAFRMAFGNNPCAKLIVKYSNASHWPHSARLMEEAVGKATNIELVGDIFDRDGMEVLYGKADVILSLHRAEGLGLVIAEGMLRGIPIIATNWSGNTDFLTRETGIPVGYDLVPAEDPQGTYDYANALWAEPHIEEAAAALRALRADPGLRDQLGKAAAEAATRLFHPARFVDEIKEIVDLYGTPRSA